MSAEEIIQPDEITIADPDNPGVKRIELTVRQHVAGKRIDSYLAGRFADYSRTFIQRLIANGQITVSGAIVKGSYKMRVGDVVQILLPELEEETIAPEDIPLDVLYEDEWLLVINKSAHIVVHPSRGHLGGTLVNAIAHHCRELSDLGGPLRPGIVHRLDRETSGVILFIKDRVVHEKIAAQFEQRQVRKRYVAIVEGAPALDSDLIDLPIGKDIRHPEKMAIRFDEDGREASTVYEVLDRFDGYALVQCRPKTGRTHQIRVHMRATGHPVVADELYSNADSLYLSEIRRIPVSPGEQPLIDRQALHAAEITFHHPALFKELTFTAPLPDDMNRALSALREFRPARKSVK